MDHYLLFGLLLLLALSFDFLNGFHGAANVVATMIASRALSPRAALLLAASGNFIGPLLFGVAVATTVGKELVEPQSVTITVVMAALLAASIWNIVTWWYGIPSSSSHALAGGLVGGAVAFGGVDMLKTAGLIKIAAALFLSPLLGFVVGWLILRLILLLARGPRRRSTAPSTGCNCSQPPVWPLATAPTTPRKPWASSPSVWSPSVSRPASTCPCG